MIDFQLAGEFEDAGKRRVVDNVRRRGELDVQAPLALRARKFAALPKEPRVAIRRLR